MPPYLWYFVYSIYWTSKDVKHGLLVILNHLKLGYWCMDGTFQATVRFQDWDIFQKAINMAWRVSWCFEPSQLLGVTPGLNTISNQSVSYSAHKSLNIDHNISVAQLFQTYTHTYPKLHIFLQNHNFSVSQLKFWEKLKGKREVYCQSDGRQELWSCICSRI